MAKLTDKSALITPANDDLLYIVDVSDTTDSGQGTSKKIEFQNIATSISYPSLLSKPSLGSLAPLDYLSYSALVSKPSLGSLAPLNELSYSALVSKPSLGSLAPLNELSYQALVSKPSLGSLAPLNTITAPYLNYAGYNGQILSINSAVSTGLSWINQPLTFRNIFINGDMSVAQRTASLASITTTGYYTADRWTAIQAFGTVTQSIENDAPTGTGLKKSLKHTFTTGKASLAASDTYIIRQVIEGQNLQNILKGTSSAKKTNLSFWVKSNVTGTYITELRDNDNTRTVSASYSISTTNTWEYKTINFPADTTGAFDNDANGSLNLSFGVAIGSNFTTGTLQTTWASQTDANRFVGQVNAAASTNNFFQITGVQFEIGDEASAFEHIPYDVNYQRCLRYCFVLQNSGTNGNGPWGQMYTTTAGRILMRFPVKLRGTPTVTNQDGNNSLFGVVANTGTISNQFSNTETIQFDITLQAGQTGALYQGIAYLGTGTFSAEL